MVPKAIIYPDQPFRTVSEPNEKVTRLAKLLEEYREIMYDFKEIKPNQSETTS